MIAVVVETRCGKYAAVSVRRHPGAQ